MRIYLDNCCFNRPFDDQSQIKIRIETEAKLFIQVGIAAYQFELAWSYILDYENNANPFKDRRESIKKWKKYAVIDIEENPLILKKSNVLNDRGVKAKDSLHIACAIASKCDYFLTTDNRLINTLKDIEEIAVINPLTFISMMEEEI